MRTPSAAITINGTLVASEFNDRLVNLSIVDKEGQTSDTIQCDLRDGGPFIAIPQKGDVIGASLGYKETGLAYFGTYTIDSPEVQCFPFGLTINGKATSIREGLKAQKERHWDDAPIATIVGEIAKDHGLTPLIDKAIGAFTYRWFGQQGESDIHFLERLSRRHDAIFSVKDGKLIFAAKGTGRGTAGEPLTVIVAAPSDIVEGTCRIQYGHRSKFRRVRAATQDRDKAERVEVTADSDEDGEADFLIGEPFADETEAQAAAGARANELKRNTITTSVTLVGNPRIRAGMPFRYRGVRPEIDDIRFVVDTATHSLSKFGYTTAVEAKLQVAAKTSTGAGAVDGTPPKPSQDTPTEQAKPDYHALVKGAPE